MQSGFCWLYVITYIITFISTFFFSFLKLVLFMLWGVLLWCWDSGCYTTELIMSSRKMRSSSIQFLKHWPAAGASEFMSRPEVTRVFQISRWPWMKWSKSQLTVMRRTKKMSLNLFKKKSFQKVVRNFEFAFWPWLVYVYDLYSLLFHVLQSRDAPIPILVLNAKSRVDTWIAPCVQKNTCWYHTTLIPFVHCMYVYERVFLS